MRDNNVPDTISQVFRRAAEDTCEAAKLDSRDRYDKAREWRQLLEKKWLKRIKGGLGTEEAIMSVL